MKNVKNVYPVRNRKFSNRANFWQVDHKIKSIFEVKGIIILPSPEAWRKCHWVRPYFKKKPREGYFIWVKKQVDFPLLTCITIASPKVSQDLTNLLVIEKNIKIKANVICNATKNNLCATHKAQGKLVLKKGAFLEYSHFHKWGKKDFVNPDYQFILGENSRLLYTYKNLFPPQNLELKTIVHSGKNSSSSLNLTVNGLNSKIKIKDILFLEQEKAQGIVRLRLVGRKDSNFLARSSIVATAPSKGHLDCQGLLISKKSSISLIPELVCKHPKAQITHEASIGRISEEQLNYLRMRGLKEKEAINLIVAGFLKL